MQTQRTNLQDPTRWGVERMKLTEAQIQDFERNGYLVFPGVFDASEVDHMRQEADYILELIINSSLAFHRRSGRLDWVRQPGGGQHIRKIQPINDMSLYLTRVSEDPRLLDPMRDIMGREPLLMEEKLNYKQPLPDPVSGLDIREAEDGFSIHNDWAYYRNQGYPQDILSSAISMDECTRDNGPLHVWPGTHHTHIEHVPVEVTMPDGTKRVGERIAPPGAVDPHGGIDCLVPPGSVMIFHALLLHNSRANTSDGPRRLMIYSHYPSGYNMAPDLRNGATRLKESPWEREYLRLKESGKVKDQFHAPTYAVSPA